MFILLFAVKPLQVNSNATKLLCVLLLYRPQFFNDFCVYVLPCLEAETPITDNPHPRRISAPLRETSPIRAERSPSPSRHPESEVLHVRNLVRPFTLNQLKELLGKHGTLAEDGFWIDKIKSHCYAVVRSVRKKALHALIFSFLHFVWSHFSTVIEPSTVFPTFEWN